MTADQLDREYSHHSVWR